MDANHADLAVAGRLRTASGAYERGELLISGGRIAGRSADIGRVPAAARMDFGAALVLPGLVDAHVHSLSHPGEGIAAATAAAAAGGVTTIVEMPFDADGPVNTPDRLRRKRDRAEEAAHVDVALLATLAPGGGWRAAEELAGLGACGFKASLFDTDPVRFPRIDDAELLEVLAAVAGADRVLCVHAENNEIVKSLIGRERAAAPDDPRAHGRSRPPVSETLGVLTALESALDRGASLHLCHLSLPRSVDLVRYYAEQGLDVTLETCPHYLACTEDDMAAQRGRLKINPPLRDERAREGLWRRLEAGAVDIIGSDHAPWPARFKDHEDVFANHSGVPGVETLLPIALSGALERGPDALNAAVDALTRAPAHRFGLAHRKGALEVGRDADIAVFDPAADTVLRAAAMHSNAGWTPYEGRRVRGRVAATLSRGAVVWDGDKLAGARGHGHVIEPQGAGRRAG
ncbi:allantoinase [Murinocardiopsis flavida]|uniref:Allantoinase n=1 Tax=Murinocardiopsis flavida TaxID=645275 RepID=A0A2P8DQD5_9ACTN|nr:amidohydrolase family protein [Murinocardiopsis flavida]PSK99402.1 allantoinase [Murinocardiopsis flavida]